MPNPSRETKFSGANVDRELFIFPVQLTTSKIRNLTRLVHVLVICVIIHACAPTVTRAPTVTCSYLTTASVLFCFCFFGEMSFFSSTLVPLPFSLCTVWRKYVVRFPRHPVVFFYLHHQLMRDSNQSNNQRINESVIDLPGSIRGCCQSGTYVVTKRYEG